MRIIYIADIHGAFDRVKQLLSETVADVYIIAGDLIDIPFYNMNTAINYHELQSYFHGLRVRMNKESMTIEDFVDELLDMPNTSAEIEESGTKYQQYTIRARRVLQQKYKVLENILSTKQKAQMFALPGNYDMDLKYTSLHERDLHLHWHNMNNLKIAGYGGADIWTPGIPERYVVRYQGSMPFDGGRNEMYNFFKAVKPDIIVSHQPAHGIHDRVNQFGTSGSPALRHYCDNNPVLLCLTGHVHMDWGFQMSENTIYLNPSNFGEVTTLTGGVAEGGSFYAIEMEGRQVERILFRKLVLDRVHDIADYYPQNGQWRETLVDAERYAALKEGRNYDAKEAKYSHIPEVQLYNEIKQFYRTFQTEETEERLEKLEQIARLIEENVHGDISMDVMGSTNMGLCENTSDIDFVVYIRCDTDFEGEISSCSQYKDAEKIIETVLKPQYDFQIMDTIDLNLVEKAIREKDYESEMAMRFVAYRAICRPINYRVIAPVEDLLNQDMEYRSELEGSIRSYFRIFINTSEHTRSFKKYESRIKEIGIHLPESVRMKIKAYFQQDPDQKDCIIDSPDDSPKR
ncbi:MAG: metallophosphoesterase family protein [Smithellaceae bacterium]